MVAVSPDQPFAGRVWRHVGALLPGRIKLLALGKHLAERVLTNLGTEIRKLICLFSLKNESKVNFHKIIPCTIDYAINTYILFADGMRVLALLSVTMLSQLKQKDGRTL